MKLDIVTQIDPADRSLAREIIASAQNSDSQSISDTQVKQAWGAVDRKDSARLLALTHLSLNLGVAVPREAARARTTEVLGPARIDPGTGKPLYEPRIINTLGPSSCDVATLTAMITAG